MMAEQARRLRYKQPFEKSLGKTAASQQQDFEKVAGEKKPGFWEKLFGKKSRPEVKPNPEIDNSIESQISRNKVKEKATEMAIEKIKDFKEKNQRYPERQDMDKIAQQIYTQFERNIAMENQEKEEQGKEKQEGFVVAKAPEKTKSRAEERRARRGGGKGAGEEAPKSGKFEEGASSIAGKKESPAELRRKKRLERKGRESDSVEGEEVSAMQEHEVELPKEEAKNLSVKDLFGGGEVNEDEEKEISLGGLEDIDELKDLDKELSEIHDDLHLTKEIETDKNKCPSCGTKTKELVFCPNCGNAFCNHCAKKVEVQSDSVGYTCPKCSSSFKLKKT